MSETRQGTLKRLWTPPEALGDGPLTTYARVVLVNALISLSVLVVMPVAFVSALIFHSPGLVAIAFAAMAVFCVSAAVREAFRIRLVLRLGRWTGWKGESIGRTEQPARFWIRTAMCGVIFAFHAAAAIALVWFNPGWPAD
jgi:hypothetical protein